jgi:hypothetical protein
VRRYTLVGFRGIFWGGNRLEAVRAPLESHGGGAPVAAIRSRPRSEGVPYTTVDLGDTGRPAVTAAFLADRVNGVPRARYQGVVLPNEAPFGADPAERTALEAYERTYGIPQVDASTWAHPEVGLDCTSDGGYAGGLDGRDATVTAAGRGAPSAISPAPSASRTTPLP